MFRKAKKYRSVSVYLLVCIFSAIGILWGYFAGLFSAEIGFVILTGAFVLTLTLFDRYRHKDTNILPREYENSTGAESSSLFDFQNAIYKSSIVSRADKSGIITFVNDNFVTISGYSAAELIGQTHRIINSGFHPPAFWADMWKTIASGRIWRAEVKNKSKAGAYYWVDTFIMPFLNEDGRVREFLSIRNDITERKRTEEELHRNKILLDKANEIASIGYWTYDQKEDQITWNEQTLQILGLPADFAGNLKSFLKLVHPDEIDKVSDAIEKTIQEGCDYNIDHRIITFRGEVRWVHEEGKVILDEYNRVSIILGVIQDITIRKEIERNLLSYYEKFQILSKATNDAIWDWDVQNDVITWNHGLETLFGYKEREIADVYTWWQNKIHPEDKGFVIAQILKCFEDKAVNWSATYRYKCANQEFKHVLDRAYIIYQDDRPLRMIGAIQDITERVESTREIEKLSLVASKTNNAVTITDENGSVEWVNDSFTAITGYRLEEVRGKNMRLLQGPQTDPITVKRIGDRLKQGKTVSEELINYTRQGKKFWLKLDISPVFNVDKSVRNFISVHSDITKLKEYEDSISSIARELASLIENANVPIFGVSADGRINEWNKVTAELSGYPKHHAIGSMLSTKLLDEPFRNEFEAVAEKLMQGIPMANLEFPIRTKDKRRLILLMSASPRRDAAGQITGGIFVAQNITELTEYRHNLEVKVTERTRELNEALSKERELVEMKSRFISIASHEFRTPLSTISIATDMVRKHHQKLSAQELDNKLAMIQKQVEHMAFMLEDILLIEKANAGKLKVQRKEIFLADFFANLCAEVEKSKGNSHQILIDQNLPVEKVDSDDKIWRSIFINLLTNAIKFSPDCQTVNVHITSTSSEIRVSVKDYGIGIPEDDRKNLFEPFFRGGNVSAIQGTGLGLSIIRKSLELLNGTIVVKSTPRKETEFIVTIPI